MITRYCASLVGLVFVMAAVYGGCSTKTRFQGQGDSGATGGAGGTAGAAGAAAGDSGGAAGGGAGGSDGGGPAACSAGDVDCQGSIPRQCSEAGERVPARADCAFACLDGQCASCSEGATECRNGAVQECVAGSWSAVEVCANTCEAGACVDACTEGVYQCDGSRSLQQCVGGVFVDDSACMSSCDSGACTGECVPDEVRCNPEADNESQSCDRLGVWSSSVPCEAGFCVAGVCRPCSPGTRQCTDSGPQLCSDAGEWVNQGACGSELPICFDGQCVLCEPGVKQCTDNAVEECLPDGSAWEVIDTCGGETPSCLDSTKTCGRCSEGETQCNNDEVQTCDAEGAWQTTESCMSPTGHCFAGNCSECDPDTGERRCSDSSTAQACDAQGNWGTTTDCTGDLPTCRADLNFVCGCEEGQRRCRNNTVPELCEGGAWVAQSACSGQLDFCLPASGECVDCVPGSQECQSGVAHQCDDQGAWQSLSSCAGAQVNCGGCGLGEPCGQDGDCGSGFCVNDVCAACRPGDRQCAGVTQFLCSNQGDWLDQGNCGGNTPVCLPSTGLCVECTNNATRSCGNCNLGSQTCSNNSWGSCSGAPNLQTSNQHCGSCNNACPSRSACSSGTCVCSNGNHGCNSTLPPCYSNTDATHCGTSCMDCTQFSGAVCDGIGCACQAYTFGCSTPSTPACGNWNFEPPLTTSGWRMGSYQTVNPPYVGSFFITNEQASSGARSLAVRIDTGGPQQSTAEFEVQLCPGAAAPGLPSMVHLKWDLRAESDAGYSFPGAASWVGIRNAGSTQTNLDCGQQLSAAGAWQTFECYTGGPNAAFYDFIVAFTAEWQGTLYIDNVSIDVDLP